MPIFTSKESLSTFEKVNETISAVFGHHLRKLTGMATDGHLAGSGNLAHYLH